ncbi:hypothetical protein ACFLVR_05550 [Chloroflexota bacterium]
MPLGNNDVRQFTYEHYKELINSLLENYSFTTFQGARESSQHQTRPLVIMRHDIDMDLEAAVSISLLEQSLGVKSTYFFMIRCPLYNMFSGIESEQVRQILEAGHHLGLHFDCALYNNISTANIEEYISNECQLLENFFGHKVEAVSFHRPGQMELKSIKLKNWPNSYEEVFTSDFEYFSDSRGNWARGNPIQSDAFTELKNLHILAHPIWWTEIETAPYDRLIQLARQIDKRTDKYLSQNCQVWDKGRDS